MNVTVIHQFQGLAELSLIWLATVVICFGVGCYIRRPS